MFVKGRLKRIFAEKYFPDSVNREPVSGCGNKIGRRKVREGKHEREGWSSMTQEAAISKSYGNRISPSR